jgi:hypothetical protein
MSIQKIAKRVDTRLSTRDFANRLWEQLDTPVSLSCHLMDKYHEYAQLVSHEINPDDYNCPLAFAKDLQSIKLLAKYPFLKTGINLKWNAEKRFIEAEMMCQETNSRFRDIGSVVNPRVHRILSSATRKIASILGDLPSLEDMDFSFGPGAAFSTRGDTSVFNKVNSTLECTTAFIPVLQQFAEEFPGWIPQGVTDVSLVPGSDMTMVPKNAKTHRSICIEPLLNGLYQKGFGSFIRDRLLRFGIDLRNQGQNQELARLALSQGLATVDFSMASDTISYGLVLHLLPIDWFMALDVARSPSYRYEGVWRSFHKFTSMGNAYTFELETMIFYALARATLEELGIEAKTGVNLGVYGDDVIIPQDAFDLYSEVTKFCGFRINVEKTFSKGQFFESCGHDYFMGMPVRPFSLKKKLNKLLPSFYAANQVKRTFIRFRDINRSVALNRASGHYQPVSHCEVDFRRSGARDFRDTYDWVVSCIPPRLRVVGPEGYGDGHLIGPKGPEESRHPSWDGWYFRTYTERAIGLSAENCPTGYALYFARSKPQVVGPVFLRDFVDIPRPTNNGFEYSQRNRTVVLRTRSLCHFEWHDLTFSV